MTRPAGNANELDFCVPVKKWPAELASTLDTTFGTKQGLEDQHVNAGCPLFVPAQPISIHPHCIGRKPESGPQGKEYLLDGSAYCMDSRGQPQAVALPIAFHPTQDPISSTDGSTHCMGTGSSGGNATVAVAVAMRGREGGATAELGDEVGNCLRASQGGGDKPHVLTSMAVRRLTPVECERLQGFPDTYTQIPWRKKPASECPDGPRYKALGNSWAVPVVRWIGRRIALSVAISASGGVR
jgi:DNA (cytosine-5)-methyltransferase 1